MCFRFHGPTIATTASAVDQGVVCIIIQTVLVTKILRPAGSGTGKHAERVIYYLNSQSHRSGDVRYFTNLIKFHGVRNKHEWVKCSI